MDWLYVWGGGLVILWGIWLFADFTADFVCGWLRDRIHHD